MKIENFEKNQFLEILLKYEVESYLTYDVIGKVGFFSGKSTLCFSNNELENFKNNLKEIEIGEVIKINDFDTNAYLSITAKDRLGHFIVVLQLGGSHQENYCKLTLDIDYNGIKEFFTL